MSTYYDTLQQLLGGETPVSISCAYTSETGDGGIEVSDMANANYVSVYLRVECGEVRPVADYPVAAGYAKVLALGCIAQIILALGDLPLETQGALS